MELTNEFEVAVPVEEAWAVLTDVERIAPCMPGAELQEVEGDEYRGIVKVKVGPITASYKGAARFEELDVTAHRAVLKAEGRETRGQGNASATITAAMEPSGEGTKVKVSTDLAITGKVAQFGRGVLADVSGKLLGQFVHNLETTVLGPPAGATPAAAASAATTPATAAAATEAPAELSATELSATEQPAHAPARPGAHARPAKRASVIKARDAAPETDQAPSTSAGHTAGDTGGAAAGNGTRSAADKKSAGSAAAAGTDTEPDTGTSEPPPPVIRQIQSAPVEPVDLGRIAGPSLMKRLWPYASAAGVLFLARIVIYALRRRKQ